MTDSLLPLELAAKQLLSDRRDRLPEMKANYWEKYTNLVASLREHVYPYINAGLSCLSKSPGLYTDHGSDHFDEVVRYAGLLLGLPEDQVQLDPYDVYLLLCAIRLHDAGNIDGREEHEKRVRNMLQLYGGSITRDQIEAELIAKIAEAHGGRTLSGNKDTIGELPENSLVSAVRCHPQQVAALVRFADEICEHSSRAARHHVNSGTLPEGNKLFHYYAMSVTGACPSRAKPFQLDLTINTKYLCEKYDAPPDEAGICKKKYLIDDILDRIGKLELERQYCNQHLDPRWQTTGLDISITLNQDKQIDGAGIMPCVVARYSFKISSAKGYPTSNNDWRCIVPQILTGSSLAKQVMQGEWK